MKRTTPSNIEVMHFLEVLYNDIGPEKIKEKVRTSLKNLKVDPYYGCMLLRPKTIAFDDQDSPHNGGYTFCTWCHSHRKSDDS